MIYKSKGNLKYCLSFLLQVLLWDVNTGQCQGSLDGHASDVTRCSFGKEILATGSRDGTVILWRYADNKRCSKISKFNQASQNL